MTFRTTQRTARLAKAGCVLLTGVSLGIACHQIGLANTHKEENEILVESGAGLLGGLVFGLSASAAVFVMSTPADWISALVIGTGSAISGYVAGKLGLAIYDSMGNEVDFATMTGIRSHCTPSAINPGAKPSFPSSMLSVL